jgi:dihydrofolate reductase
MTEHHVGRIEGYAIISEDGMLATADRVMPESLKFEADQEFFERGLDDVDVIVHGRYSQEQQARSPLRHRLILTGRIPSIAAHASNPRARLWNPAGASFKEALAALGAPGPNIAVIGGAEVFALFLDQYDVFYLTRAPGVWLPGGRPVFPEVPAQTPEEILAGHGLAPGPGVVLDAQRGLTLVGWLRDHASSTA